MNLVTSYKQNYMVNTPLSLTSLMSVNFIHVIAHSCKFHHFHFQIILNCVNLPQFLIHFTVDGQSNDFSLVLWRKMLLKVVLIPNDLRNIISCNISWSQKKTAINVQCQVVSLWFFPDLMCKEPIYSFVKWGHLKYQRGVNYYYYK